MNLEDYFKRINYSGPREPTLDVLNAIHAAHLRTISYENLDIHLGVEVTLGLVQIVDKIVNRQRGGWCFEMNSLLAWVLTELGFNVTLLGAAVGRQDGDESTHLNHLVLRVDLDESYLVDTGFGNGFLYPIPLAEGTYRQDFVQHDLCIQNGYWCYKNITDGFGYDFTTQPRAIEEFAAQCQRLQTSPESGFVKSTVTQRFIDDRHVALRGLVLKEMSAKGITKRDIDTHAEYSKLLTDTFRLGLTQPQIDQLWAIVKHKHREWVAAGRP